MGNTHRILFAASPSVGHLVPLLTLAHAARDAGHEIALTSAASMAGLVGSVPLLAVGPGWSKLGEENARRHPGGVGSTPPPLNPSPDQVADFFARTRLDLAAEDALDTAREFRPDIVVADAADSIGPFVAAALGVPWAAHGFGTPIPASFADALRDAAAPTFAAFGVAPTPRTAFLDPWPDTLVNTTTAPDPDRITLTLDAYAGDGPAWQPPDRSTGRRRVLLTFGTTVNDPGALSSALGSVLEHTDLDVIVTRGAMGPTGVDDARVTEVDFVPLAELLPAVDLAVVAGGAGTVLGALAAGLPLVFLPFFPDQVWHGAQVADFGSGLVAERADQVGGLVRDVVDDLPRFQDRAAALRQDVEALGSPRDALDRLLDKALTNPQRNGAHHD